MEMQMVQKGSGECGKFVRCGGQFSDDNELE